MGRRMNSKCIHVLRLLIRWGFYKKKTDFVHYNIMYMGPIEHGHKKIIWARVNVPIRHLLLRNKCVLYIDATRGQERSTTRINHCLCQYNKAFQIIRNFWIINKYHVKSKRNKKCLFNYHQHIIIMTYSDLIIIPIQHKLLRPTPQSQ